MDPSFWAGSAVGSTRRARAGPSTHVQDESVAWRILGSKSMASAPAHTLDAMDTIGMEAEVPINDAQSSALAFRSNPCAKAS